MVGGASVVPLAAAGGAQEPRLARHCAAVPRLPPYAAHRVRLFALHGITADTARTEDDPALLKVRSAGRALLGKKAPLLPAERRAALEAQLCAHFGVAELSEQHVTDASTVPVTRERQGWVAPEAQLMQALLARGEPARSEALRELQASWRQAFYDALQPTHLPVGWDIHHDPFAHSAARSAKQGDDGGKVEPTYRANGEFIDERLHNGNRCSSSSPVACADG